MHGYHFAGDLHRRRLGAGKRALAGSHDRRAGRRDARLRVRRRRAGRLGDPLPQVASHHERHGPRRDEPSSASTRRISREAIRKLVPDYMPMGSAGMAEMGEMEMPMPDNTLPMMTGFGQFGPMEMGGMFSVVKVREGLARRRLHATPAGTSIRRAPSPTKSQAPAPAPRAQASKPPANQRPEFNVVKPGSKSGHSSQHQSLKGDERHETYRLMHFAASLPSSRAALHRPRRHGRMATKPFRPASPAIRRSRRASSRSS